MNEQELDCARKRFVGLENKNKKSLMRQEEVKKLLKDPTVQKYLSLEKYLKYKELSKREIAYTAFSSVNISKESSNKILVYIGSYNDFGQMLSENDLEIKNKTFWDLETMEIYNVPLAECDKFEKQHLIIFIPFQVSSSEEYSRIFFKIRSYFFEQLIDNSQEEVTKRLRKKRNIERIISKK